MCHTTNAALNNFDTLISMLWMDFIFSLFINVICPLHIIFWISKVWQIFYLIHLLHHVDGTVLLLCDTVTSAWCCHVYVILSRLCDTATSVWYCHWPRKGSSIEVQLYLYMWFMGQVNIIFSSFTLQRIINYLLIWYYLR